MKYLKPHHIFLALYVVIGFLVFKNVIFNGLTIGIKSDWPIPSLNTQILQQVRDDVFSAWSSNYFGYERVRQTGNYVDLFVGFIARTFGVGGDVISKYPFFLIILSGIVCFYVLRKFGIDDRASFIGGIFYTYGVPFLYDSMINGYLKFLVCYAFFPVFFYFAFKTLGNKSFSLKNTLFLAFFYVLFSTALNFFFIGFLFLLFIFLFDAIRARFNIKYLIVKTVEIFTATSIVVLVQATAFLLPLYNLFFLEPGSTINSLKSSLVTFLTFAHPKTLEAFKLFFVIDNFFERSAPDYGIKQILYLVYYALVFVLVFGNFFIARKSREVFYTITLLVLLLFVIKGVNLPFGYINMSFYRLPLMAVVRNISYLYLVIGFCYTFLIANLLSFIFGKLSKVQILTYIVWPLIAAFVIFSSPVMHLTFFDNLSYFKTTENEKKNFDMLASESGDFNIYQLPTPSPFNHMDPTLKKNAGPGFNPYVTNPPKPTLTSAVNDGNNPGANATVFNTTFFPYTDGLNYLLNIFNVKYITFNTKFKSLYPTFIISASNTWFKSLVLNDSLIENLKRFGIFLKPFGDSASLYSYKIPNYTDSKITFTRNLILDVGSYENLRTRGNIQGLDVGNINGVFVEDYKEPLSKYISLIHLDNSSLLDFAMGLVDSKYKYQPGNFMDINRNDPRKEWTPIFHGQYWWYDPILVQNENSVIYLSKEGNRTYEIPVGFVKNEKNLIFAKVLKSIDSGDIRFYVDEKPLGVVPTKSLDFKGFSYMKVGEITPLVSDGIIKFEASEGTNSVSNLVIIPESVFSTSAEKAGSLLTQKPVLLTYNANVSEGIGENNSLFDFYYARVNLPPTSDSLTMNIPKSGLYDLSVLMSRRKRAFDENLRSIYFKTVSLDHDLTQNFTVSEDLDSPELCLSYSYIDIRLDRPSTRVADKPLEISIIDNASGAVLLHKQLASEKIYSEGDWLYDCMDFDTEGITGFGPKNVSLTLSSKSKKIVWGIPYDSDVSETGYKIKYQLNGYSKANDTAITAKVNGNVYTRNLSNSTNRWIVDFGKIHVGKGNIHIDLNCSGECLIQKVYLREQFKLVADNQYADYTKMSPSEYKFVFSDIKEPNGVLIFKESLSPSWKVFGLKVGEQIQLNGFQNAWIVSGAVGQDAGQKIEGRLFFVKQTIYDISNILSFLVLGVLVCGLSFILVKNYVRKN